jgi:uroporphyrinogen decarboxylase
MRLLAALLGERLDRPPVWLMRQAGRYLPEYRELRSRHGFEEAMRSPDLAAEITLQPLRRFPLDAAIVFADIMTPLAAMGVDVVFDPGPRLSPLTMDEVADLPEPDMIRLGHVGETIGLARAALDREAALIGFAGAPVTVLAYLLEGGGGSQHFPSFRSAFHRQDPQPALARLASATNSYLRAQVKAGADVIQLFDTWAGLLAADQFRRWAVPAARVALAGLEVPTIYFAPGAAHLLGLFPGVGATAYGVDWRLPLDVAWGRIGVVHPIQGNLDPSVLLAGPEASRRAVAGVLGRARGRPGHVFNLGHGVLPGTPLESVAAVVDTVVEHAPEKVVVG